MARKAKRRGSTPKSDTPKSDTPKSDTPKSETPKSERPESETPEGGTPATDEAPPADAAPADPAADPAADPGAEPDAGTEAASEAPAGEDEGDGKGDAAAGEGEPGADPGAEIAELNDKLLRALAEAENVRRRAERDKEETGKYAVSNFAREMLGVADNLTRAMGAVDETTRKQDDAVDQVMIGLEMTHREMLNTLERFGIKPIEAMGEKFDHHRHEAMFEIEDPEKPAGTVVQVMETGYLLHDRLLRPAKVGVAKGGPKDAAAADADASEALEPAPKEGRTAYEDKGAEPGAQLDEEL